MKKTYTKPDLYIKKIATNPLMGASIEADPSGEHDEGGGNQDINAKQSWGNVWDE